jgi:citrate synthase
MALAKELGFSEGPYVKLAFAIEKVLLQSRWRLHVNIAAIAAALAADQGLSRQEYYLIAILCFSAGMFPCYLDTMNKPEGAFFPLRCDRVTYVGKSQRIWGKA